MKRQQLMRAFFVVAAVGVTITLFLIKANLKTLPFSRVASRLVNYASAISSNQSIKFIINDTNDEDLLMVTKGIEAISYRYDTPLVYREQKLLFCWIPKNSCTQFKALFCRLAGRKIDNPYNHSRAVHSGGCIGKFRVKAKDEVTVFSNNSGYVLGAALRDPFDKFLSSFLEKCVRNFIICFGCNKNITCFARNLFLYMNKTSNTPHLRSIRVNGADHMFPQFWFCRFSRYKNLYHTILLNQSEASRENIRAFFRPRFPNKLIDTGWGPNQTQPFFYANSRTKNFDHIKRYHLEVFFSHAHSIRFWLQTYAVDYVYLGLPMPKWLTRYCCSGPCRCSLKHCIYELCMTSTDGLIDEYYLENKV